MKLSRPGRARLISAFGSLAGLAVVAVGVAGAPNGAGATAPVSLYAAGHAFGIGEQQVYLIDRSSTLVVRYRDSNGDVHPKTFHYHALTSVGWTVEGLTSTGGPILGVATAAPSPSGSQTPSNPTSQPTPQSPAPSPTLDARGATAPAAGSALAELAPASVLLSGLSAEPPEVGKSWKSSGQVQLPFGNLTIVLDNVAIAPSGDQDSNVAQINSTGTSGFWAKVKVGGSFGQAALRGGGAASATSYLETQNHLLLGTSIMATSHGNATAAAHQQHGTYELQVKISVKLVKYVPGFVPYNGSPGFVPASGYLGGTTAPDMQIYATTLPDALAAPAATDTGFIPPPAVATPYQSALPEISLPPIPLPMASGQAAASPPAGPTPTPQPTHY